jgi:outer membrane protein assembly factor BamB
MPRYFFLLPFLLVAPLAWADDVRMVLPEGDGMANWPRWRGPSGQGIVPDGAYPDAWSPTENVVWKVPVPGKGNASPIIWRDRIYLTTAVDGGKQRLVLCFNRADGKLLWQSGPKVEKVEGVYSKNSHASATPSTDGQRIYVYFGNGGLYACDLSGQESWHTPLPPVSTLHGPAGTQLLYKDRIIFYQDSNKPGGFIAAFDKNTGKELWKTPRKETVGWGTPIAITVAGKDQIIVSGQHHVYAYDPATGAEIWKSSGNLDEVIPTPVVGLDMLFCSSGRAGPTLALRPTGQGDITKTHLAWKKTKGSPFIPSPLLYGDKLFLVNDMVSVISCLDAKTGALHWEERCGDARSEGFTASPIGVNNKVFFTNDTGETYVIANSPKFELHHVNRLTEKTLASPALMEGRWYIRTEKHLWCIGK